MRRVRRVRHAAGAAGAPRWRGAHHCAKARRVGIQRARQRERARGVRLRRGARRVTVAPRLQPVHHRQQVGRRAALVRGATGVVPRGSQLAAAAHVREREHPAARRQHSALCPPLGVQRHAIWQSTRRMRGQPKDLQVGGSVFEWRSLTGPVYGEQSGVTGGGYMFAIASNFSSTQIASRSAQISTKKFATRPSPNCE